MTNGNSVPMTTMNGANNTTEKETGFGTGFARPSLSARVPSKPRVDSPAMGTTDEAYSGLAHGMHGVDGGRPENARTVSKIV